MFTRACLLWTCP